ncbi:NtaA/DmoA family FMN-dependent monooxygenase [Kineococcus rhizosphaerae]|uniref:FMN-dependent oxidoreductase (Nitrilotriacetate monooxygenase family) n=1 Tax=Kineococcus rhizosphaerae TaxID=559628 RepID=A0A2T0R680_9ACTN|nr:NtaA/DmoA family FMN-dependent monooxygenase [Kineococcus rhizosphaerae]PRY16647.1 FMN-dependent oxidoreductase (nitrilotriacetate monooxygenase family) [Kineococcus rhizosphaerae]
MHLGVFEVAAPQVGGTLSWSHPYSDSVHHREQQHWIEVAQLLEAAGFDFLFFADGYGYPSVGGDLPEAAARGGLNFTGIDPMLLIPTLAHHTSRLGFVVTSSTGIDHPVAMARRFATLDHLTGGRIGWNVVTGASQDTIAGLFGHDGMTPHDTRYEIAREYVDLCLQLWEGCWEDAALVQDKESGVFADRSKLHRVEHVGKHFRSSGFFTVVPSAQRTPVLFQAGSSAAGREFAAAQAECVFLQGTTPAHAAANVADLRARAAAAGRDPRSVKVLVGATVTVAATHDEALARRAEFEALQTDEVAAVIYAGNTGIDLTALDPDRPLSQINEAAADSRIGQMGQSNIDRFRRPDGSWPLVREVLDELRGRGTRGFTVVGDPVEVADQLEEIMDVTDVDGFLLEAIFSPGDHRLFCDLVVPELRRRGRLPEPDHAPGTGSLRERLGADSPRLPSDHPGARYVPTPA